MTTNHEHLREVAEKATPGPWEVEEAVCGEHGTSTTAIYHRHNYRVHEVIETGCSCGDEAISPANADFIATFNPATAIDLLDELAALRKENERLNAIINTPQADDFLCAVSTEAEHQRQRWGSSHDGGKAPADWFWLIGYLAGKALHAHAAGNTEKGEHHIITTAAACANWHRAMFGGTNMRPGIDADRAAIGDSHE